MDITLIGRRWFQKSYGNTYHTVTVQVDGETVYDSPIEYGYGDQYTQTGLDWLQVNGYIDRKQYANGGREAMWQYAEREGIKYSAHASDVARERDL